MPLTIEVDLSCDMCGKSYDNQVVNAEDVRYYLDKTGEIIQAMKESAKDEDWGRLQTKLGWYCNFACPACIKSKEHEELISWGPPDRT